MKIQLRQRSTTVCVLLGCLFWPASSYATDLGSELYQLVEPFAKAPAKSRFTRIYDDEIRHAVNTYWAGGPDWLWWKAQLFQESGLDPGAESPVGAAGLAQFMPATWADVSAQLKFGTVSPYTASYSITAGAYYMSQLRAAWSAKRPVMEKHRLAQASYNAGFGHILSAQRLCDNALLWQDISPCLFKVTGENNARQTTDYINRISQWHQDMVAEPGH